MILISGRVEKGIEWLNILVRLSRKMIELGTHKCYSIVSVLSKGYTTCQEAVVLLNLSSKKRAAFVFPCLKAEGGYAPIR